MNTAAVFSKLELDTINRNPAKLVSIIKTEKEKIPVRNIFSGVRVSVPTVYSEIIPDRQIKNIAGPSTVIT